MLVTTFVLALCDGSRVTAEGASVGECNLMEGWGPARGTYLGPLPGAARLGAGGAPLTTAWGADTNANGYMQNRIVENWGKIHFETQSSSFALLFQNNINITFLI